MTDNDLHTSRRSTLKLVSGTAVGAAGVGTATATDDEQTEDPQEQPDSGDTTELFLRLESTPAAFSNSTTEEIKLATEEAQQPVLDSLQQTSSVTVKRQFWITNAILIETTEDFETARSTFSSLSGVREVHRNFTIEPPEPVERNNFVTEDHGEYTYGLEQINAPEFWEQFDTKGEGVSVAVLDTGIDADHPDIEFDGDNWGFWDRTGQRVESEPFDPNGHGTHTSGTVAGGTASELNGEHFGVAPEVELYHGKVLNNAGTLAQIVAGMEWAVEQDVDVINMSLGGAGYDPAYIEPIQNARENGTIVVTSAGNSGSGSSGSPGNIHDSFSIGASNEARGITDFSSGEVVNKDEFEAAWLTEDWPLTYVVPDVSAPGSDVLSAEPDGRYAELSGTSMAAPHTAGAVALLLSADPSLELSEIENYLEGTARHGDGPNAPQDIRYGEGIIDVLAAGTAATDSNIVTGTVTTTDGTAVPNTTVTAPGYGTEALTDENGEFQLYVGDGDWELAVNLFGLSGTANVSVSGGKTVTQDIEVEDQLAVASGAVPPTATWEQPDVVAPGESFDIVVNVANLEALTVSLADDSDLGADALTLSILDTELTLGETLSLEEPLSGNAALSVTVSEDASEGSFSLAHTFEGVGDTLELPTGPTEVMSDPEPAALEIVDWEDVQEVEVGGTIRTSCTVENTGDRTAREQIQWFMITEAFPDGVAVPQAPVAVESDETTTIEYSITAAAQFGFGPGTEATHGWITQADQVSTTVTAFAPDFVFMNEDPASAIDAPSEVNRGATVEVTASITNVGNASGETDLIYYFDESTVQWEKPSAEPGETVEMSFELDTTRVAPGEYAHGIAIGFAPPAQLPITVTPTSVPRLVDGVKPTDPDGDGRYEDITGDGKVTLEDVQAFSRMFRSDKVQNNPQYFDFNGDGKVSVADLQALFDEARN